MPSSRTSSICARQTCKSVADYLLDTNHATRLMAQDGPVASRVEQARAGGDRLGLSVTVLAELYFAIHASRRRQQNLRRLRALTDALLLLSFDEEAAEAFRRIQAEQRAKGRPIPPLDAQIAAVARVHGLTVLTSDRHFWFVSDIAVQDWQD